MKYTTIHTENTRRAHHIMTAFGFLVITVGSASIVIEAFRFIAGNFITNTIALALLSLISTGIAGYGLYILMHEETVWGTPRAKDGLKAFTAGIIFVAADILLLRNIG